MPGTEGRKKKLRFNGHANNLLWGPPSFFTTPNFADTYSPIVKLLHDGPSRDAHLKDYGRATQPAATDAVSQRVASSSNDDPAPLEGYLSSSAPRMPSLRRMHEIVAANPRAQARFFLLMSELHYRYNLGIERLHIGRITLARPLVPVQDDVASSLQPSIAPGTTDMQAPLESQARGFTHGHGKGHSIIGATMSWLRNAVTSGFTSAVRKLREALCDMASTVQYDAAREPARQMGVLLRPEPFTAKQQRQSRLDGGEEEDGAPREHVDLAPPLQQPHVERERLVAAADSRNPRLGSAAYREVPLTGAIQATYPAYRQRSHFGEIGDVIQLAESAPRLMMRRLEDMYTLDDEGKIVDVLLPDGTPSTDADRATDARQWAQHFGTDVFNNQCHNHEHDCKATCVKYVKQQLEAQSSLRSNKVPTCRFWFFRRVKVNTKYKRRRGKPLVAKVFIAEDDERKQEFRCQVVREQPFRSTSNDVSQASPCVLPS